MTKTTITKAQKFTNMSRRSRPATAGNKNIFKGGGNMASNTQVAGARKLFRATKTAATMR